MQKIILILLALLIQCFPRFVNADHTSGANLTYECLGGNTYELKLDFFRDCNGLNGSGGCNLSFNGNCSAISGSSCSAPGPVFFSYYSPSCGLCATDSFLVSSLLITEVSPVCPAVNSSCNGGVVAGMQKWTYKRTITLPSQCNDWNFIYGTFARNISLTTIVNPTGSGFAISATLDNLTAPCNSSPSFSSPNVNYLCVGQPYCFNQGVIESDGDSLVYTLSRPRDGVFANNYVNYIGGYSFTNPFGPGSPVTFDQSTGSLCVTPASAMVTLIAVTVTEYRNGALIGSTQRDIEFIVTSCSNTAPVTSGVNGGPYAGNDSISVCANTPTCFTVTGSDVNASDSLTMTWDTGIPGGSFTITNTNPFAPEAQFCWTPTLADASTIPHVFTIAIRDNACPYDAVQYFPFFVYVNNCSTVPVAAFSAPNDLCPGTCTDFVNLSTNATSYLWSFAGANPGTSTDIDPTNICYNTPGTYDVSLIASGAFGIDTLTLPNYITVYPYPAPQGITQSGDTLFANQGAVSYQWYYTGNLIPGATDYYYIAAVSGDYNVVATDVNGCEVEAAIFDVIAGTGSLTFGQWSIYPSPVANILTIKNSEPVSKSGFEILVYDISGQKLMEAQLAHDNKPANLNADVSALSPGIYILKITSEGKNSWKKFIKI